MLLSDKKSKTFCLKVTYSLPNIFLEFSNFTESRDCIPDFSHFSTCSSGNEWLEFKGQDLFSQAKYISLCWLLQLDNLHTSMLR